MKTIYKYPIQLVDMQFVEMPANAEIISTAMQGGVLCLWAMVDSSHNVNDSKAIAVVGTGNPFPDDVKKFIGTVFDRNFVWHVFEC